MPIELLRIDQSGIFALPQGYTTSQVVSVKDNEKVLELYEYAIIDEERIDVIESTPTSKIFAWIVV